MERPAARLELHLADLDPDHPAYRGAQAELMQDLRDVPAKLIDDLPVPSDVGAAKGAASELVMYAAAAYWLAALADILHRWLGRDRRRSLTIRYVVDGNEIELTVEGDVSSDALTEVLQATVSSSTRGDRLDSKSVDGGSPVGRRRVFISYARSDGEAAAARLEAKLREAGFRTWRDRRDIDISADFTAELERAVRASAAVILCVTPSVLRPDSYVRREIAFAQLAHRPVVVARFADIVPPISVATNTFIDFHVSEEDAMSQVLRFLRRT